MAVDNFNVQGDLFFMDDTFTWKKYLIDINISRNASLRIFLEAILAELPDELKSLKYVHFKIFLHNFATPEEAAARESEIKAYLSEIKLDPFPRLCIYQFDGGAILRKAHVIEFLKTAIKSFKKIIVDKEQVDYKNELEKQRVKWLLSLIPEDMPSFSKYANWSKDEILQELQKLDPSRAALSSQPQQKSNDLSNSSFQSFLNTNNYFNLKNLQALFADFVRAYLDAWNADLESSPLYYAPYFAVVQGSCAGKTRMVIQSKSQFVMIYINIRPEEAGEPERSSIADTFLSSGDNKLAMMKFYIALFSTIKTWLDDKFIPLDQHTNKISTEEASNQINTGTFWEAVNAKYSALEVDNDNDAQYIISKILVELELHLPRNSLFLVAIDEARNMLPTEKGKVNSFFNWRHAIQILKGHRVFNVVMDTLSTVSNFTPYHIYDTSSRVVKGQKLFPPFYMLPVTGSWPLLDSAYISNIDLEDGLQYSIYDPVQYSRPKFREIITSRRKEFDKFMIWNTMVNFARWKITFTSHEEDLYYHLACLSSKFNLLPHSVDLKNHLLSSRCATLLAVAGDYSSMDVRYIPEPMLVEGVTRNLQNAEFFAMCLKTLGRCLRSKIIGAAANKGDLGELLAAIYIMRIKDLTTAKVCEAKKELLGGETIFSLPIKLHTFLKPFLKKAIKWTTMCRPYHKNNELFYQPYTKYSFEDQPADLKDFPNYYINFTAFHKVDEDVTIEMLCDAVKHNIALFVQEKQEAIDFLIPLIAVDNSSGKIFSELIKKEFLSVMLFQVKFHTGTKSLSYCRDMCEQQCRFARKNGWVSQSIGIVAVLMAVGDGITGVGNFAYMWDHGDLYIFISQLPSICEDHPIESLKLDMDSTPIVELKEECKKLNVRGAAVCDVYRNMLKWDESKSEKVQFVDDARLNQWTKICGEILSPLILSGNMTSLHTQVTSKRQSNKLPSKEGEASGTSFLVWSDAHRLPGLLVGDTIKIIDCSEGIKRNVVLKKRLKPFENNNLYELNNNKVTKAFVEGLILFKKDCCSADDDTWLNFVGKIIDDGVKNIVTNAKRGKARNHKLSEEDFKTSLEERWNLFLEEKKDKIGADEVPVPHSLLGNEYVEEEYDEDVEHDEYVEYDEDVEDEYDENDEYAFPESLENQHANENPIRQQTNESKEEAEQNQFHYSDVDSSIMESEGDDVRVGETVEKLDNMKVV